MPLLSVTPGTRTRARFLLLLLLLLLLLFASTRFLPVYSVPTTTTTTPSCYCCWCYCQWWWCSSSCCSSSCCFGLCGGVHLSLFVSDFRSSTLCPMYMMMGVLLKRMGRRHIVYHPNIENMSMDWICMHACVYCKYCKYLQYLKGENGMSIAAAAAASFAAGYGEYPSHSDVHTCVPHIIIRIVIRFGPPPPEEQRHCAYCVMMISDDIRYQWSTKGYDHRCKTTCDSV